MQRPTQKSFYIMRSLAPLQDRQREASRCLLEGQIRIAPLVMPTEGGVVKQTWMIERPADRNFIVEVRR